MPLRRHALALLLALATSTTASAAIQVAPAAPLSADAQRLVDSVAEAIVQSDRGDALGAMIVFERVLADPALSQVPADARQDAWVAAGMTALKSGQNADAERYLRTALAARADDPRAIYLLARLQVQQQQPRDAALNLARSLQLTDRFNSEIKSDLIGYLLHQLKDDPTTRRTLLQALFDRQWQDNGMEPARLWRSLATLQADAGEQDRLAATVARIDDPTQLIALRSDKRFDQVIDRSNPRFDPALSARRYTDALRVAALLRPEEGILPVRMADTLLMTGDDAAVIAMTDSIAASVQAQDTTAPRTYEGADDLAWLLYSRARAQRRLGDMDAALATQAQALRFHDSDAPNTVQYLVLAGWQMSLQRPQQALDTLAVLPAELGYWEFGRQWLRLTVFRQLNDRTQGDAARDWLLGHPDEADLVLVDVLLEDNRMDDAAARLIAQLRSPEERGDALVSLQDYRTVPSLPGDAVRDQRWRQLKQRADVRAAVQAVGRIERIDLFGSDPTR
jgi:tetratricopeptide (TPR) repeat protein